MDNLRERVRRMTVFDDRLLDHLTQIATDGEIQVSAADLADTLDCSDKSVRRALDRLEDDGRLSRLDTPGQPPTFTLLPGGAVQGVQTGQAHPPPLQGGVGGGTTPVQTGHTRNTPPGREQKQSEAKPKPSRPDPNCRRCEGTGFVFVDVPANTVTICDCRGAEAVHHDAARRAANNRSWGGPPLGTGPVAKPDYFAVWVAHTRHHLDHPEDQP